MNDAQFKHFRFMPGPEKLKRRNRFLTKLGAVVLASAALIIGLTTVITSI